jgi:hypothetical protein
MNRIFSATLYLDPDSGPATPDGPGWYVDIRTKNGSVEVAPKVKIDQRLAGLLAAAFDKAVANRTPHYSDSASIQRLDQSVVQAVREATDGAREAVAEQLRQAEEIAQRLAELRRTYEEFGGE